MEDDLALKPRRPWVVPACEALDLAATAGGPPGGADQHGQGSAGCNPNNPNCS